MPTSSSTPVAPVLDQVHRIESLGSLDQPATSLRRAALSLPPSVRSILGGAWSGHPLHPVMTDLPIGFWTSSWTLDLVGGHRSRAASQRLVGLGVLTAVPTLATGLQAFSGVDDDASRRVGVVHAAGAALTTATYLASWASRRSGHHGRGVAWGMVGATIATAVGYLGGHLAFGEDVSDPDGPASSEPDG